MTALQMIIIVFFSACTGWIISWLTLRILFSSTGKKIQVRFAITAGKALQQEFQSHGIIDDKIADPALLEKMKPEIEKHVDFFLNEKLATVFPLLYKFMGEKTLMQFKNAFMAEIDLLFPVVIKNYIGSLKTTLQLDEIIAEKIEKIPTRTIRDLFFEHARKEILYFKLACTGVGILMGLLALLAAFFLS
ncbi:MAG: hypothetical protein QM737_00700 [Ferruginibacter sp.]